MHPSHPPLRVVLVTGMSGAGKSSALKAFEDMGYESLDNLPLRFVMPLLSQPVMPEFTSQGLALGLDVRARDFTPEAFVELLRLMKTVPGIQPEVLFLDCEDEVLRRRFTETRRKHPLAQDRRVVEGIQAERQLLEGVQEVATFTIDSSEITAADLKERLRQRYLNRETGLTIQVVSFSFRRGLPREADLVFDVRFLRNPHYIESLQPLTGQNPEVGEYIEQDAAFEPFFASLSTMLLPLLPRYLAEGKSYLTIAIGCTGGKHRSVHTVQKLAGFLSQNGYKATTRHRDMPVAPI